MEASRLWSCLRIIGCCDSFCRLYLETHHSIKLRPFLYISRAVSSASASFSSLGAKHRHFLSNRLSENLIPSDCFEVVHRPPFVTSRNRGPVLNQCWKSFACLSILQGNTLVSIPPAIFTCCLAAGETAQPTQTAYLA